MHRLEKKMHDMRIKFYWMQNEDCGLGYSLLEL